MDVKLVSERLAAVAAGVEDPAGGKLHGYSHVANSVDDPAFIVADIDIEPEYTMGGRYAALFTCWLMVSTEDPQQGQDRLKIMISPGTPSTSIYSAIRQARGEPGELALGGAAVNLQLQKIKLDRAYQVGARHYYGAELKIMVWGESIGH